MTTKKDIFIEENITDENEEHKSPTGKYKLLINYFKTGEHTWNYSQGSFFKDDKLIAIVQRNYSHFPFAWIENHKNGHDYVI